MFKTWSEMTDAEREAINRSEDIREARKEAMARGWEDREDDYPMGDPRRCPSHPNVVTSSADGLHDAPCGACEHASWEAEQDEDDPIVARRMGHPVRLSTLDDDTPF
jgi:hypothetical protein